MAAQNFDELHQAQDMSFVIKGETFTMQWVKPEILAEFEDEDTADSALASLEKLDGLLVKFLIPGDVDRWKALRERDEDPVTFAQLKAILRWMVEAQSNRPTETPSRSARGRGRVAASSGAASG